MLAVLPTLPVHLNSHMMLAASALRPAALAARPSPARRACAPRPGLARPSIVAAAAADASKGSSQPPAAAAAAAAALAAAGLLLAHAGPALAEDGSRGTAVITSPSALEFPGQLDAPAAAQAPALRTSPQAAANAGAGTNDIAQVSLTWYMACARLICGMISGVCIC